MLGTAKRTTSCLMAIVLTLCFMLATFTGAATAAGDAFQVEKTKVEVGETFVVSFTQPQTLTLSSLTLKIGFDKDAFEITTIAEAPYADVQPGIPISNQDGETAISYADKTNDANTTIVEGTELLNVTFKVKDTATIGDKIVKINLYEVTGEYDELTYTLIDITPDEATVGAKTKTVTVVPPVVPVDPVIGTPVAATPVTVGDALSASTLSGTFKNADDEEVAGTLAWTDPATVVSATGDFDWAFTPTDTEAYNSITGTVNVVANPAPVDISALNNAITGANTNKGTAVVSVDGKDVNPSNQWVTSTEMQTYLEAIAAAQVVADKEEPDLDEVNQAIEALNAATAAFNDAKKDGKAIYAFDVLVGKDVEKVYEFGEGEGVDTYPVCNGLLVYVAEDDPERAVTMSFTSGENGDSGVYDVILEEAYLDGFIDFDFLFTELPTVPSVISLTEGAGFSLSYSGDYKYTSKPTGDGTDYFSLYQGFEFKDLPENGELQATFTATLPRSDGAPVVRTINLTVRHNPELLNPHTVTISGGGSGASGAGDYYKGETVNINAGNRSGYTFTGWTSDEVTITNASNKNASFIMPAKAVTVTANWKSSGSSSPGGGGAVAPTVTGIEIKAAPDKVSYDEGDKLDLTGLEVTVTYSDGKTKDIAAEDFAKNGITVSPKAGEVLDADVTAIEIKADGKTVKQVIVVDKKDIVTPPDIDKPVEKPVLTDIDGHWAEDYIEYLVGIGAISGYPDGTFRPDAPITRAEFAKVIVDAFELKGSGKVFDDTADHWAKNYVAIAAANGIVLGYNENEFGPDDLITREQMAIIIVKAAGLKEQTGVLDFIDEGNVSSWAYNWVVSAVDNNLMSGYEDNSFKPLNNATRAEAATVIYNILMK